MAVRKGLAQQPAFVRRDSSRRDRGAVVLRDMDRSHLCSGPDKVDLRLREVRGGAAAMQCDANFEVDEWSWGVGFALRYKKRFGLRYDYAHYPISELFLDEFVDRNGITAFVDLGGILLNRPTSGEKF